MKDPEKKEATTKQDVLLLHLEIVSAFYEIINSMNREHGSAIWIDMKVHSDHQLKLDLYDRGECSDQGHWGNGYNHVWIERLKEPDFRERHLFANTVYGLRRLPWGLEKRGHEWEYWTFIFN